MPIYFWWGEDDYQRQGQIQQLRKLVDPLWQDFNYREIEAKDETAISAGLTEAVTPVFGTGDRLTWLRDTHLGQKCSDWLLQELERSFSHLPQNSHLLFTADSKPDSRLKVGKLLQKYADMREFSPIPPWQADKIAAYIRASADRIGVALSPPAINYLVTAVGNDLRRLDMELSKLALAYPPPLTANQVKELVLSTAGNSIQLAQALRHGDSDRALGLLAELQRCNEAGLRICATLVGQFRTWVLVKLAGAEGKTDSEIAQLAELGNPKRVYFLKQEVENHSLSQWLKTLPILLELESNLKRGADELTALTTAVYQICQLWSS